MFTTDENITKIQKNVEKGSILGNILDIRFLLRGVETEKKYEKVKDCL